MNVNGTGVSSDSSIVNLISDLIDKSPALFGKVKAIFKKDKGEEKGGEEDADDDIPPELDEV